MKKLSTANEILHFIFTEYFEWANSTVEHGATHERKCPLASKSFEFRGLHELVK